jgi:hypothetical protein
MKNSKISIPMSYFGKNVWFEAVLISPNEYSIKAIPKRGIYISFKCYLVSKYLKDKRVFDIVFPYNKFERVIKCIPQNARNDITRPIRFEFMIDSNKEINIRNWRYA